MFCNFAVVLQRLVAVWLLIWAWKRNIADLQQLRRREKRHVRGIVEDRVAQAALIHQDAAKSGALCLDRTSHACWTGANHQNIETVLFPCIARVGSHILSLDDHVKPWNGPVVTVAEGEVRKRFPNAIFKIAIPLFLRIGTGR